MGEDKTVNVKKRGEIVEVLKESIKAKKEKEDAERELRERDMFNHAAAISQALLEKQQQFQLQQQVMTMAFANGMTELLISNFL